MPSQATDEPHLTRRTCHADSKSHVNPYIHSVLFHHLQGRKKHPRFVDPTMIQLYICSRSFSDSDPHCAGDKPTPQFLDPARLSVFGFIGASRFVTSRATMLRSQFVTTLQHRIFKFTSELDQFCHSFNFGFSCDFRSFLAWLFTLRTRWLRLLCSCAGDCTQWS